MTSTASRKLPAPYISGAKALGIWVACAVVLWTLEARYALKVDNLSIGLILAASLASVYLTPLTTFLATLAAMAVFSFFLIPPIGSVKMQLQVHQELVIFTSLTVAILVGFLTSRLRQQMELSANQAIRSHQLTALGEKIRHTASPIEEAPAILTLVENATRARGAIWCQSTPLSANSQPPLVASHVGQEQLDAFTASMDSVVLQYSVYAKHQGRTLLLLPIRGAAHHFGVMALDLAPGQNQIETSFIDEALISLDVWAKAMEIAWQSVEVMRSREMAYQRGIHNSLLAAVSHEFRTPLSTILMAATSLIEQKGQLSPQVLDERLQAIGREAKHLRTVTHHILELARLESGQGSLHTAWESAEELVGIAVRRFEATHPGTKVATTVAPSLPLFQCDQVLLLQLLDNLLDNALRHGGPRDPALHAWSDGPTLRIAVRDQGAGVDARLLDTLFTPYQSRERHIGEGPAPAQQQVRKGFGLGLPLCRAIAQAHGGDVALEYSTRQGSSFLITLPISSESPSILEEGGAP